MNSLLAADLVLTAEYPVLAGVDEAGRGALAGPVVAAAVIMDYAVCIEGIDDSKKLSAKARERLFDCIIASALSYRICAIEQSVIDEQNILQATLIAMREAVSGLSCGIDLCLIDGNRAPSEMPCATRTVIDGDCLHYSIAAASILAKVYRDRLMLAWDAQYPQYGFASHKGYGTARHLQALREHGPCALHRMTFAPVAQLSIPL